MWEISIRYIKGPKRRKNANILLLSHYVLCGENICQLIDTSKLNINGPCWSHQMETFSARLSLCEGNPLVTGGFPSQRPVTRSFDVFFDHLHKRLRTKQSRLWWFESLSRSLWRHCNAFPRLVLCVEKPIINLSAHKLSSAIGSPTAAFHHGLVKDGLAAGWLLAGHMRFSTRLTTQHLIAFMTWRNANYSEFLQLYFIEMCCINVWICATILQYDNNGDG